MEIVLLIQIVVTVLTTTVSLISLKKDERSRTAALKKEIATIKPIIYIVAGISILNSSASYLTAKKEKHVSDSTNFALNKNLNILRTYNLKISKQNIDLSKALSDSSLAQLKLIITSQQKSANQLSNAADNLSHLINGTDSVPIFSFNNENKNIVNGVLRNVTNDPAFNIIRVITNFTYFEKCVLSYSNKIKRYVVTKDCFNDNHIVLPIFPVIAANTNQVINLPKFDKIPKGKYSVLIKLRNIFYIEEAIYIYQSNVLQQSTRILELSADLQHIKRRWTTKNENGNPLYQNVNWQEEFPDIYFLNLGTTAS